ncbi:hypothetical protein Scep_002765 [Stephania cephalantha]|uniref:Magnesium transporter n=1 Tax=Stephania cephalantha TaxID=152367 RepID=A0AAP0Q670_9MAGN
MAQQQQQQQQQRRKGSATRTWLVISESGKSHVEEVGKHSIMRRTGLPARDLRILDPVLFYPSTVLGRERAIVVNLEHIKAIITASEVLVLNSMDPSVIPFVRELECRVEGKEEEEEEEAMIGMKKNGSSGEMAVVAKGDGPKVLPFEFKALEVCLESACRRLENETSTLEQEAYPALDELTSKISTLNLQRVRHIKSRLVALYGRVQKVRDELENLLDDDMDMAEMYLTDKLAHQLEDNDLRNDVVDGDSKSDDESDDDLKSNKSSSGNVTGFKPNIEELEMLLEAYFAQIEGTMNKLSTMREYVDDTEDYINIMLDDKQNQLLQMGVLLSTANLFINAGIVVVGLFGMNIHIELFDASPTQFWETTGGTIVGCLIIYLIAIFFGKKGGLLG